MTRLIVLPVLATLAFGQETPGVVDPSDTTRRGERVFNRVDSAGTTAETRATLPAQGKRYQPRRGDRVFNWRDSTGPVTEMRAMPSPRMRYEPRRNYRVFYFGDRNRPAAEKVATPAREEVEKK